MSDVNEEAFPKEVYELGKKLAEQNEEAAKNYIYEVRSIIEKIGIKYLPKLVDLNIKILKNNAFEDEAEEFFDGISSSLQNIKEEDRDRVIDLTYKIADYNGDAATSFIYRIGEIAKESNDIDRFINPGIEMLKKGYNSAAEWYFYELSELGKHKKDLEWIVDTGMKIASIRDSTAASYFVGISESLDIPRKELHKLLDIGIKMVKCPEADEDTADTLYFEQVIPSLKSIPKQNLKKLVDIGVEIAQKDVWAAYLYFNQLEKIPKHLTKKDLTILRDLAEIGIRIDKDEWRGWDEACEYFEKIPKLLKKFKGKRNLGEMYKELLYKILEKD